MHKIKSHKSVEQIAKKHRLEVSFVNKQLEMGIPIEHEHTKDKDLATDISLQHLDEIPDYYTRLKKMESSAKKSHDKKYKDVTEAKKMKGKDPCWKGYEMIGKKKKGGREVPNCVPVKEQVGVYRFCPKCNKNETSEECKYGKKYWEMFSVPVSLASNAYDPNTPHPGNFPESYEYEYSNWRADFGLSEDWQKVNRKDKTDGLSQKAVNAYRKENPGSKLQTAVTEKDPKGKRARRQVAFCRRMKGMRSKLTSKKTARDPDSRINKALRRWRCR